MSCQGCILEGDCHACMMGWFELGPALIERVVYPKVTVHQGPDIIQWMDRPFERHEVFKIIEFGNEGKIREDIYFGGIDPYESK